MESKIIDIAKEWLSESYDIITQKEVASLISIGGEGLIESFYKDVITRILKMSFVLQFTFF